MGDRVKILRNDLRNELNLRTEKDFPVKGIEFIDITPLILQKNVLNEITDKFIENIKNKNIDYIVAPEARGFIFGTAVAVKLNIGCIPVRKKGKLPGSVVEKQFEYEKEYGVDVLELPKLVHSKYKGKKFYIIDDIYATGNTVKAITNAIESLGGIVVGTGVVLNIKELNSDNIYSIIDINEEN